MRAWMVFLLVATALTGCTDPGPVEVDPLDAEPEPPAPEPDPEQDPEPPAPEPNTAPTAALAADATTGDAPMNVTFTLDGSDADGDNLTWTFDREDDGVVDDQGDALPATLVHAYAAGTFTARLTVYDGEAEANATLLIESFEPAGPEEPAGPVQELVLAWPVGGTDLLAALGIAGVQCEAGPADGVLYASFEVDPATRSLPVAATLAHDPPGEAIHGWGFIFFDEACTDYHIVSATGTAPVTGTVPDAAAWAFAYSDGGAGLEVAYRAG